MGLFDFLRKPKRTLPLPQLCYDVAYFILPHYVYNDLGKLVDLCLKTPNAAGPFFYLMACKMRKVQPVMEDAPRFRWHIGTMAGEREYFALEYPPPPSVDMSNVSPEELVGAKSAFVLAPYFSAVVRGREPGEVEYFILGQAPFGGETTLRAVHRGGGNFNLGPGPEPQLAAFLDAVQARTGEKDG
jgi:hypothetical protein